MALLVFVAYLPVVLISGPDKLVANRFVAPLSWDQFIESLPTALGHTWAEWFGCFDEAEKLSLLKLLGRLEAHLKRGLPGHRPADAGRPALRRAATRRPGAGSGLRRTIGDGCAVTPDAVRCRPVQRPTFNPRFHVEVVDGEGVYLLSERGHSLLKGDLYCQVGRLLDGQRTIDTSWTRWPTGPVPPRSTIAAARGLPRPDERRGGRDLGGG